MMRKYHVRFGGGPTEKYPVRWATRRRPTLHRADGARALLILREEGIEGYLPLRKFTIGGDGVGNYVLLLHNAPI